MAWLERAARASPMEHAYALWDLVQAPDRTRFVSTVSEGATRAYLLLWHGSSNAVIAHWVGAPDPELLPWLPTPPCVLLVPTDVAPLVTAQRPGLVGSLTDLMLRDRSHPLPTDGRGVRRLHGGDRGQLPGFLPRDSPMHPGYARLDPDVEPAWGAFEGGRIIGAAHVTVSLPFVWVISGVYTRPDFRGRGVAQAVTAAISRHAEALGASAGLFVREENLPAVRAYEKLGFRAVGRKVWFESLTPLVA